MQNLFCSPLFFNLLNWEVLGSVSYRIGGKKIEKKRGQIHRTGSKAKQT